MSDQSTIPPQTSAKGAPTSPLELTGPDWKESLRRAAKEFKADRGTMTAAGMAFYWFLAIFPALLAAVGFIGLVGVGPEFARKLNDAIGSFMPGDAAEILGPSLEGTGGRSSGSGFAALFGTAVALFSASAGMVALQVGLDVVYDVEEDRKYLKQRLHALLLLLVTAVLGGVATALIVFGQPLGEALRDNLPFGSAFVLLWTLLRWVLGIFALTILFASYYYLGPNRRTPRWTWISPGGILATVIWLAASLGFSFYVSSFGSYAETYGSLAGVVVLLLWLFLSGLAIVLGGELNAELERQGEHRRRQRRGRRRTASGQATAQEAGPPTQAAPTGTGHVSQQPAASSEAKGYEDEWAKRMRQLREGSGSSR